MNLFIGFVTGGLSFNPDSLKSGGLGGSETALIQMARALAKRGHIVKVFCNLIGDSREYEGVHYIPVDDFGHLSMKWEYDILIVHRAVEVLAHKMKAATIWYWAHDILTDANVVAGYLWQTDRILLLSEFHKKQYIGKMKELEPLIRLTRNGLDWDLLKDLPERFAAKTLKKTVTKFVYSSRPERGLPHLLNSIWPKLIHRLPNAELHIAFYDLQNMPTPPGYKEFLALTMQQIKTTPQVTFHGGLAKKELYDLIASSNAMLYPCDFPEISCITAMEAMACGTTMITTNDYALPETLAGSGLLVSGKPGTDSYVNDFVDLAVQVAVTPSMTGEQRNTGSLYAMKHYDWNVIAEEWEQEIFKFLSNRCLNNARKILDNLIYQSDVVAARDWAKDLGFSDYVEKTQKIIDNNAIEEDEFFDRSGMHQNWQGNGRFKNVLSFIGKERLMAAKSWVDIGCLTGDFIALINNELPHLKCQGFDYSLKCVEEARRFIKEVGKEPDNVKFSEGRMEDLPTKFKHLEGTADVVFAGEILEHIEDTQASLATLEWIARDGGIVCLTLPSGPWEVISLRRDPNVTLRHIHHFSLADIREILGHKKGLDADMVPAFTTDRGELVGNWIVSWTVDKQNTTFGKVNLQRKVITTRPYENIAVCMIAKNEEDNIGRCLKSVKLIADEIYMYDCVSTDDTVSIAKKHGATIIPGTLDPDGDGLGNFSAWRNASIQQAKASWILWIDADEVLTGGSALLKYLHSSLYNGYVIQQCHLTLDTTSPPDTPIRLFKNGQGYLFKGVIHEHAEAGGEGVFDKVIEPCLNVPDSKIAHYGYINEAVRRQKCTHRNMALLVKDRKMNPNRILGRALEIRDCLNMAMWDSQAGRPLNTEDHIRRLRGVVQEVKKHFWEPDAPYRKLVFPYYQHALQLIATYKLGLDAEGTTPIESLVRCEGSVGGFTQDQPNGAYTMWFSDKEEMKRYFTVTVDAVVGETK